MLPKCNNTFLLSRPNSLQNFTKIGSKRSKLQIRIRFQNRISDPYDKLNIFALDHYLSIHKISRISVNKFLSNLVLMILLISGYSPDLDPDWHKNLEIYFSHYVWPPYKILSKSVHNFPSSFSTPLNIRIR